MARRRPIWSGCSFGSVSALKGNFDDNAEPAMFVRARFESLLFAIGLVEPIANVGEADAGRLAGRHAAALAIAIVRDLDAHPLADAARADTDVGPAFARSHRIFDGIFDQRLEQ